MQPSKLFDLDAFRREVLNDPLVQNVWNVKYRLKRPDGFVEQSIEESKRRVVEAVYARDPDKKALQEALDAVLDGYFLPAGRVNAGAGTGRNVTLMNCYVADTVHDSMPGIQKAIAKDAFTLQQGGGVGMDFSTVRPAGAIVSRTGSVASGSIAFMEQRSAMSATVCSAGERRGALMTTLRCDHPDLWNEEQFETATDYNGNKFLKNPSFISVKRQAGRLTQTNISVLVTDAFMQAVESDADWDLGFFTPCADGRHVDVYEKPFPYDAFEMDNDFVPHLSERTFAKGDMHPWYVYRRVKARRIWDDIMRSTYKYAEPGVIFVDRVNERNNLHYCETLSCTNPCFSGDTLITTREGAVPIVDLVGREVTVWTGSRWYKTDTFRVTGHDQPMLRILLQDGSSLRVTHRHKMVLADGTKIDAINLSPGDSLMLTHVAYDGSVEAPAAYLKGFMLGDGHLCEGRRPQLLLYPPKYGCGDRLIKSAAELPCGDVRTNASISIGFNAQKNDQGERRSMTGLAPRQDDLVGWCSAYKEGLPSEVFQWDRWSKAELIAGLFDSDGSVVDGSNGFSYQMTSIHRSFLSDINILLKSLGVRSKVGLMKGPREVLMPGGTYQTKPCWRLSVPQADSITLAQCVRFSRLPSFADRKTKYERHTLKAGLVIEVEDDGVDETVYCCTIEPEHTIALAIGTVTGNCGEQPLPPFGCCDLGSVNLSFMVDDPFTPKAKLNFDVLRKTVHTAVRFLDNVLDVSAYPLREQREESMNKRRIGLGLTGVADALLQMGVRYGSLAAQNYLKYWTQFIQEHSYRASANLAAERGHFPLFRRDDFLASPNVAKIPEEVRDLIKKNGIRNGVLNTVAPNGTISIYSGNTGQGIEPVFSFDKVTRKVRQPDGTLVPYESVNYAYRLYEAIHGPTERKDLPDYFVGAMDIPPSEHILMQAACQEFIDASISKTVNVPTETSFEDFKDLYALAYQLGCKGTTTYRYDPDSGRGSVLSVEESKPAEGAPQNVAMDEAIITAAEGLSFDKPNVAPRDRVLQGRTYKVKWPPTGKNWYVTINHDADSVPVEVFITGGEEGHVEWIQAMGRLLTAVLRRGGDVKFLVNELTAVHAAGAGGFITEQRAYRPSVVAAIGGVLEEEFRQLGLFGVKATTTEDLPVAPPMVTRPHTLLTPKPSFVEAVMGPVICPNCHVGALVREEGCMRCVSCDYSKCG